jgi:hypothetical protein
VSGVGDDANACSRTAPCKTFAGAISKTVAGGIINCLDPGGFGAVTITKSITIDCEGTFGGVLAAGTNAINVNVTANDVVILRHLDIEGIGTGLTGVNHVQAGVLHIQKCRIFGFRGALGVNFQPSGGGKLYITDSYIHDIGAGTTGGGIQLRPTGVALTRAVINRTVVNNNFIGIVADGGGGVGGMSVMVSDSIISGNQNFGIFGTSTSGPVALVVDRVVVAANGNLAGSGGILASGASTIVRVGGSTITGNIVGVSATNGATLVSYGTNQIDGNAGGETIGRTPLK